MVLNANKLSEAQEIIDDMTGKKAKVVRIKKETGLLEREETEKVILVEDNRQLICG